VGYNSIDGEPGVFYICYRGKRLYGPMSEAEALQEWFALAGTIKELYIVETDEATGRIKRQIGPAVRKKRNSPIRP
jgi:hypothetical protein